jgi:predicted transcriptional regulator
MTTMTMPMSLKIDVSTRERLTKLAHSRKRTAHAIAREAVESYVIREEAKDKFTADSLAAWKDYQETGLHATSEEVLNWIQSWGTPNELKPPVCHL